MNKERLLELADLLETDKVSSHFAMDDYFRLPSGRRMGISLGNKLDACGAVACIAGWAVAQFDPQAKVSYSEIKMRAADLLDLEQVASDNLFTPDNEQICWSEISHLDAARTIRSYVETGKVDWSWHPDYREYSED